MLPTFGTCHPDLEATNTKLIDAASAADTAVEKVKGQVEDNAQPLRTGKEEHDATMKHVGGISKPNEDTAAYLASVSARAPGNASYKFPTPTSGARSKCAVFKGTEGGKVLVQGIGVGAARYYSCDKGPCRAIVCYSFFIIISLYF